jgi:DUF1009 family protein
MKKLGIIAGSGGLPKKLIDFCRLQGRPFFVLAVDGHADKTLIPKDIPVKWVRLGAIGSFFKEMKQAGAKEIVLIGGIKRPSLKELKPDLKAVKFFSKVGLKALGDDGLLSCVISEIEKDGFKVVGIDRVMPSLLAKKGVYGKIKPSQSDTADIKRGFQVAKILGQADVGQSVIVQQGLVLAVEGIEGTAALIERAGPLKRKGGGGVLVKTSKPRQERRIDLPTVGPDTVRQIHSAGFKGIALEAGCVLVVEEEEMIRLADKLKIFIVGV